MPRKPKTNRVPRTRAGGEWTEASYWQFIRSLLRQGSIRWPPRKQAENRVKRKSQSANKRLKWEYQCERCGEWRPRKEVELDHIVPCGTLRCADDIPGFVERLFCDADGFQMLCKSGCHAEKTGRGRTPKER